MTHALFAVWYMKQVVGYLLLCYLFLVWHEFGHIFAAFILGIRVKKIGISLKGAYTIRDIGPPHKNLIISFFGPLVSIIIGLILLKAHLDFYAIMNFVIAGSNLLPIKNSDGDRMWTCWQQIQKEHKCRTHNN